MEVATASPTWVQSLYSPLRRTCQLLAVNWGMDIVAPSVVEVAGSDNSVVTVDTVSDPAMIPQSFQHLTFSLRPHLLITIVVAIWAQASATN